MRQLVPIIAAAAIIGVPVAATVARADDTTVIKRDNDTGSKTIIKKKDDENVRPVPHSEENDTIIKKHDE